MYATCMKKKFVRAWTASMWLTVPHAILSTFLAFGGAYAACFGQPNEDLMWSLPYMLLNVFTVLTRIPGSTSIILFGIMFAIATSMNRKLQEEVQLSKIKEIFLFLIFPSLLFLAIGLQIFYGTLSPP